MSSLFQLISDSLLSGSAFGVFCGKREKGNEKIIILKSLCVLNKISEYELYEYLLFLHSQVCGLKCRKLRKHLSYRPTVITNFLFEMITCSYKLKLYLLLFQILIYN
jgi:hypothetical protein